MVCIGLTSENDAMPLDEGQQRTPRRIDLLSKGREP
jgi:hypothetical protein